MGLLPAGYGPNPIPTLLGSDGTADGNYTERSPNWSVGYASARWA